MSKTRDTLAMALRVDQRFKVMKKFIEMLEQLGNIEDDRDELTAEVVELATKKLSLERHVNQLGREIDLLGATAEQDKLRMENASKAHERELRKMTLQATENVRQTREDAQRLADRITGSVEQRHKALKATNAKLQQDQRDLQKAKADLQKEVERLQRTVKNA